MLRGKDRTQMNMASEQRTELWTRNAAVHLSLIARLRRARPLQREMHAAVARGHPVRSFP